MLEVVKLIADTLGRFVDPKAIAVALRERDKRRLGAELFVFYASLNEVVSDGDSIVSSLESFCAAFEAAHNDEFEYKSSSGSDWFEEKLLRQRSSLVRFGKSAQRLSAELQIVDRDACRRLRPLISGKLNALDGLLRALRTARLPMNEPDIASLLELGSLDDNGEELAYELQVEMRYAIQNDFLKDSLLIRRPWNRSTYRIVKNYLSQRDPKSKLDEIADIAGAIRDSLEKYFSVADILLEVRDARLKDAHDKYLS